MLRHHHEERVLGHPGGSSLDTSPPRRASKTLLWPGASQLRIYYHRMRVQLSTTCSNVLKHPNGELLFAVNHNQLRTVASETVDPIDWSHPPPSWAVPPERLVHSINQCNLCAGAERATAACEATTLPIRPLRV